MTNKQRSCHPAALLLLVATAGRADAFGPQQQGWAGARVATGSPHIPVTRWGSSPLSTSVLPMDSGSADFYVGDCDQAANRDSREDIWGLNRNLQPHHVEYTVAITDSYHDIC